MHKAHDFIGLPVVDTKSGKQWGTIRDILWGHDLNLYGVLLELKHWLHKHCHMIMKQHIISFGEDAVTIIDNTAITELDPSLVRVAAVNGPKSLKGVAVLTATGTKLGVIEDVYFDQIMGMQIIGLELSDGFISDITKGRQWIPVPSNIIAGANAVIISASNDAAL